MQVPPNGLVIYCGTILTDENKERKVNIDFEPFKPINTSLYLCDNKFHTEALQELLASDDKFGFIIMDGNGCLYGTLSGNAREVIHKFSVDLPKKHGRGGQSALRFARLRLEKRQNYVTKCAEIATQMFITNDKVWNTYRRANWFCWQCGASRIVCMAVRYSSASHPPRPGPTPSRPTRLTALVVALAPSQCNVGGIVLAGSADFKVVLSESEKFDPRLAAKVLKTVDVSYGGENGFNQAIELSQDTLGNVRFVQEKKLISQYFEQISQDTGKFCFGIEDTLKGLEMGAVQILIVWENLADMRYTLKDPSTGEEVLKHLTVEGEKDPTNFQTKEGVELEVVDKLQLVEWFATNYKNFGATLEFVTNRSQEGSQFVKGFGGVGGILRYKVDFMEHGYEDEDSD